MANKNKCGLCSKGTWKPAEFPTTRTVAGIEFTATLRGETCSHCAQSAIPVQELEAFEIAVAQRLAALAIRNGDAFRFMRKSMGLPAKELANLLRVTPESVSRWENQAPDHRAFAVLSALVNEHVNGKTTLLDHLRAPDSRSVLEPVQVTLPRRRAS